MSNQNFKIYGDLKVITTPDLITGLTNGKISFAKENEQTIGEFRVFGSTQSSYRLVLDTSSITNGLSIRTNSAQGAIEEGGQGSEYTFNCNKTFSTMRVPFTCYPINPTYNTQTIFKCEHTTSGVTNAEMAEFVQTNYTANQSNYISVGQYADDYRIMLGYRNTTGTIDAVNNYGYVGMKGYPNSTENIKLYQNGNTYIPFRLNAGIVNATTYENLPPVPTSEFLPITLDKTNNRVGVNQLTPAFGLDVVGGTQTDTLYLTTPPTATAANQLYYDTTTKQISVGAVPATFNPLPITLDKTNNRVGINQTTPTCALDVSGVVNASSYSVNGVSILRSTGTKLALGPSAGPTQGINAVAIGNLAGTSQADGAIGIGYGTGISQGASAIAIGYLSASATAQGSNSIAIGPISGNSNQGANAVAVGYASGNYFQGARSVSVGLNAGYSGAGEDSISIGNEAGYVNKGADSTAIGRLAGNTAQGQYSVALGAQAGQTNQGSESIAIGYQSGVSGQNTNAISIGKQSGYQSQSTNAIAIGNNAGNYTQGSNSTAMGFLSGALNQGANCISIGQYAGYTGQGANSIALGYLAGQTNQSSNAVAIGANAGISTQGSQATAVGLNSGKTNQGEGAVAIGRESGGDTQGVNGVAIGSQAGRYTQSTQSVAIGTNAGLQSQGQSSVAIGQGAGNQYQSNYSNAIGYLAGQTNQHANTNILNASGSALNSVQASSFYVKPIRNASGPMQLYYDPATGEITYN